MTEQTPASPEGPTGDETLEVIVGALDNLYRDVRSNPDIVDQGYAQAAKRIRQALTDGSLRLVSAPLLTAERGRADHNAAAVNDNARQIERLRGEVRAIKREAREARERADALRRQVDAALAWLDEYGPIHTFDCDRFEVYDYGTRQGKCDCAAANLRAALSRTDPGSTR